MQASQINAANLKKTLRNLCVRAPGERSTAPRRRRRRRRRRWAVRPPALHDSVVPATFFALFSDAGAVENEQGIFD
jgi:hypothetical protein